MSMFKNRKIIATLTAAAMLMALLIANLAGTFAQQNDYTESFTDPYAQYVITLEVNQTASTPSNTRAFSWTNGDSTVLAMTAGPSAKSASVQGLKPGVSTVVAGLDNGQILSYRYKVVDNTNITSYTVTGGLEGLIGKKDGTLVIPVSTTPGAAVDKITWVSLNGNVASISGRTITAVADSGSAIILGTFADKWGVAHTIPFLVTIGAGSGSGNTGGNRGLLTELILEGIGKLNENPNPYTKDSLNDLRDAVIGGTAVANNKNASDSEIDNAIADLQNALNNLQNKPILPEGVLEGDDGNYYKPVGNPPNVFEEVDENGNSKSNPPKFVYNPNGKPGNGNDRPAISDGKGGFLVEDPEGSNIWKKVGNDGKLVNHPVIWGGKDRNPNSSDARPAFPDGKGGYLVEDPIGSNIWKGIDENGNLVQEPAIWGGPDGQPGGGDDKPVVKFGDGYWVHAGQNVWQKVDKLELGPLTGGGPDENPTTNGVLEIVDNRANDGKFYVGPMGPDEDGNLFFFGDPKNGNGKLESDAAQAHGDDVTYYLDSNGNMTTTKPAKQPEPSEPSEYPNVVNGRTLTTDKTGDSSDWVEIAQYSNQYGDFSLIVRTNYVSWNSNALFSNNSTGYNDPNWNWMPFCTTPGNMPISYERSYVRNNINDWFNGTNQVENLDKHARLRDYAMQSNAFFAQGTVNDPKKSLYDGLSLPTKYQVGVGNDIAFALSFSEAAQYCSQQSYLGGPAYKESHEYAKKNYKKINIPNKMQHFMWLRTIGGCYNGYAGALYNEYYPQSAGAVNQSANTNTGNSCGYAYPAMWVKSAIFNSQAN